MGKYKSKYNGEEIDALLDKAGGIDATVERVEKIEDVTNNIKRINKGIYELKVGDKLTLSGASVIKTINKGVFARFVRDISGCSLKEAVNAYNAIHDSTKKAEFDVISTSYILNDAAEISKLIVRVNTEQINKYVIASGIDFHAPNLAEKKDLGAECTEQDILDIFKASDFSEDFNDDFGTND